MLPNNTKKVNSESANSCRKYRSLINLFHKWFDYSAVENALTGNHGTLSRLLFIDVRWCVLNMSWTKQKHFYSFLLFLSLWHDKINLNINVLYLQNFQKSVPWKVIKFNTLRYQKSWANYLKTLLILSNSKFWLSQAKKSRKFRTDKATFENEGIWMAKISESFWFSSKKWPILIFLGQPTALSPEVAKWC